MKKFDKDFNLEPTEYRKSDAKEPFWGFAAKDTLILFVVGIVVSVIATRLIGGEFPYWVRHFLE